MLCGKRNFQEMQGTKVEFVVDSENKRKKASMRILTGKQLHDIKWLPGQ